MGGVRLELTGHVSRRQSDASRVVGSLRFLCEKCASFHILLSAGMNLTAHSFMTYMKLGCGGNARLIAAGANYTGTEADNNDAQIWSIIGPQDVSLSSKRRRIALHNQGDRRTWDSTIGSSWSNSTNDLYIDISYMNKSGAMSRHYKRKQAPFGQKYPDCTIDALTRLVQS